MSQIDWKAKTGADAIDKGQFGEFTIDADGLPDTGSEVVFKAIQTYANGDVVRWIDPVTPGGPAAEHPTPILELTNPAGNATPDDRAGVRRGGRHRGGRLPRRTTVRAPSGSSPSCSARSRCCSRPAP